MKIEHGQHFNEKQGCYVNHTDVWSDRGYSRLAGIVPLPAVKQFLERYRKATDEKTRDTDSQRPRLSVIADNAE